MSGLPAGSFGGLVGARVGFVRPPLSRRRRHCGLRNGEAVDVLLRAGFDAWGHDLSAFREWQRGARARRDRLVVADGLTLPVSDGFFDAVISSGVLEHVGVSERGGPGIYEVSPLPDRDERRLAFLAGLARVVVSGGTLHLDFPNGAFCLLCADDGSGLHMARRDAVESLPDAVASPADPTPRRIRLTTEGSADPRRASAAPRGLRGGGQLLRWPRAFPPSPRGDIARHP